MESASIVDVMIGAGAENDDVEIIEADNSVPVNSSVFFIIYDVSVAIILAVH